MKEKNNFNISELESKKIDILRFLFIIMVVYVHSYSKNMEAFNGDFLNGFEYFISNILSRCAVPGFFLISSILLYRKEFKWLNNLKDKFKSLLIPYIILNLFWIVFFFVMQRISFTKAYFVDSNNIINNWNLLDYLDAFLGFKTTLPILYPLWFVRDLFVLNILSKIIKKVVDSFPKIIFITTILLWLFLKSTNLFFLNVQAICFWIFGYYYVKTNIHIKKDTKNTIILSVLYFAFLLLDFIYTKSDYQLQFHRISMALGVVFWYSCITNLLVSNKYILKISKHTTFIYFFHELLLTIIKKMCFKLFPINVCLLTIEYIFIPLFVCVVCIIFSIFLRKKTPLFYNLLTGNRLNKY